MDRIDELAKEVEELNQKVESLRSHILGIYEGKMLNIKFEEKNRRNIDIMTSSISDPIQKERLKYFKKGTPARILGE